MARSLPIALFVSIITALLGAQEARAYPVLMEAKAFPSLGDASRDVLIAIAPCKDGAFRRIPLQFDEVEHGAAVVFRKPSTSLSIRKEHAHPSNKDQEAMLGEYAKNGVRFDVTPIY